MLGTQKPNASHPQHDGLDSLGKSAWPEAAWLASPVQWEGNGNSTETNRAPDLSISNSTVMQKGYISFTIGKRRHFLGLSKATLDVRQISKIAKEHSTASFRKGLEDF